jgi:hypothetical protein
MSGTGRWTAFIAPFALALMALPVVPASAQQTTVTAGVNVRFLSGSFGSDETTNLLSAPAVLRVERDQFEASAYFPYLMIDNGTVAPSQGGFVPMRGTVAGAPAVGMSMGGSAGGSMGGSMGGMMGGGPAGGTNALSSLDTSTRSLLTNWSGVGDIVATAGYRIVDDAVAGVQIVLSGRLKVPTASATKGLGTGKADVGAAGTIRKYLEAGWVYAEGGYLFIGDPDDVDLRNAVLWAFGGGRRMTDRIALLFSASGNTALLADFAAPVEVGAGVGIRAGRATLSIVPTVGLSDASPRYAINIGFGADIVRGSSRD